MVSILKSLKIISNLLIFTLIISFLLTGFLFELQNYLLSGVSGAKPFHFLRIFSRLLTIVLFVVVVWYCLRIEKRSLRSYGLEVHSLSKKKLWIGFGFGILSMSLLILLNLFFCDSKLEFKANTILLFRDMVLQLFVVFTIALVEEWFFRGFLLQTLVKDFGIRISVIGSSLFFAATHFVRPVTNWIHLLPEFFGLFLIGLILANASVYTRSLHFSIGIHAGWVYIVKLDKFFINHFDSQLQRVFGGEKLLKGITAWILILLILTYLKKIVNWIFPTLAVEKDRVPNETNSSIQRI